MSPSSENNRLLDTGRHWQLWSSRWSSTEEQLTPDFPSAELCHHFLFYFYFKGLFFKDWKISSLRCAIHFRALEGSTVVHMRAQPCSCALLRKSQAHHYHILWALNSGSQSLRTPRSPLSPCHVNAPSWLRLVQLVAPTHTVISRRGGRTVRARGQSEWWLGRSGVCLVLWTCYGLCCICDFSRCLWRFKKSLNYRNISDVTGAQTFFSLQWVTFTCLLVCFRNLNNCGS